MTEDVLISVRGLHALDTAEEDEVEVTSAGKYFLKNGKHFIIYEEVEPETGAVSHNRIKVSEGRLELHKKGAVNSNLNFEQGVKSTSWYGTPFGEMLLGIDVKEMKLEVQEHQIDVEVRYELEVNYEHVADSDIQIRVMEREKGLFRLK